MSHKTKELTRGDDITRFDKPSLANGKPIREFNTFQPLIILSIIIACTPVKGEQLSCLKLHNSI